MNLNDNARQQKHQSKTQKSQNRERSCEVTTQTIYFDRKYCDFMILSKFCKETKKNKERTRFKIGNSPDSATDIHVFLQAECQQGLGKSH